MVIATHHEGDVIHFNHELDIVVLGVDQGKVKFGLASNASAPLDQYILPPFAGRPRPESRTATIAVVVGRPERGIAAETICCELRKGLVTIRGRTRSYYLSQPGRLPMLVITCEEAQRIRINDAIDIVVLDVHDNQAVHDAACDTSLGSAARHLVKRLRRARQAASPRTLLDGLWPEAAFSL